MDAVYDEEALAYACAEHYDGIILDIMMPKTSGLEVLSSLRKKGCRTPVLLLTAKSEGEDRIQGLDLGADDYLPKPFVMGELLARIRAMLRRRETYRRMCLPAESFILPNLEYRLMELFILNQETYLSSEDLAYKGMGL